MTIGINTGMQLLRNFFEIPLTFNRTHPIEYTWAQIKSIRNKMKLSVEELFTTAAISHLFIVR